MPSEQARRTFRYKSTVKILPPSLSPERVKVDDFYAARSGLIPPLPWSTFSPPFSAGPRCLSLPAARECRDHLGGQLHVSAVGRRGMTGAPQILLAHHLKTLKLPTFLREHEKLARQCAAEGLDHVQFLARLVELELIDREGRMIERRIKAAKFPAKKSLDSFDFKAIPKLNKMQVLELARCEWIERREN